MCVCGKEGCSLDGWTIDGVWHGDKPYEEKGYSVPLIELESDYVRWMYDTRHSLEVEARLDKLYKNK